MSLLTRCLTVACALIVAASVSAGAASRRQAAPGSTTIDGRQSQSLSDGWRFRFGADADLVGALAAIDDRTWQAVRLPHTWNRLGSYGLTRSATSDNRQGVGWYRLRYRAPALAAGRRVYLDFPAVGNLAQVFVNGTRVGEHRGAYSRFRIDVTPAWRPGAENLIAVRADNTKPERGSTTAETLPLAGDFFIYGGLYRGVSLLTAPAAGIDLLDFGGPGVYARTTAATPTTASVSVLTRLRNATGMPATLDAVTTISDAAGRIVARSSAPATIAAASNGEMTQTLTVVRPHLWNGTADPYLYRVTVALMDGAHTVDRVIQPLGIRTFRFDANQGFFLNGFHVALHGVSRHQDRLGEGAALHAQDYAEDMALIRDMGANSIRGAHYEHADEWYAEADRAGMVMWAEVPFVTASAYDGTDGSPATFVNGEQQVAELIRQQYNHPSIMMWSVGNEVDASALYLTRGVVPRSLRLLQDLNARAHAEDPSRPTTFADCCEDTPFAIRGAQALAGTTDLMGLNRYPGWYYGRTEQMGPLLDAMHAKHPAIPLSVTEYGAGGAISQHSDNPAVAPFHPFGRPQPEEAQSLYHEQTWPQLRARPYLYASWLWNMFDFASDFRNEGDSVDLNTKGLVLFDHRTRKDAFYYYRAQWSPQPTLHLNSARYVDRPYPVADIRAYSNADRVSLSINGRMIGTVACVDHVCQWPGVALNAGRNHVRIAAAINGRQLTDTTTWTAPAASAGLHIDSGNIVGRVSEGGIRYGSDTFVTGGEARWLTPPMPGVTPVTVAGPGNWMADFYRAGAFRYDLPLPDGRWTVTVHSFEPQPGLAGSRTFGVRANGASVIAGFNPARAAGGTLRMTSRSFVATSTGGHLVLEFVPEGGPPIVAALDVVPTR